MALNDDPRIASTTALRVKELAGRLGYQRDPLLSALASSGGRNARGRATANLAVVAGWERREAQFTNLASRQMFEAARAQAALLGYSLDYFWTKESRNAAHATEILRNRGVVGIIVEYLPGLHRGHYSLGWEHFSCVALGYSLYRPELHRVVPAFYHGALSVFRRLQKMGYRRIGLVVDRQSDRYSIGEYRAANYMVYHDQEVAFEREPIPPFEHEDYSPAVRNAYARWFHEHAPDAVLTVAPALVAQLTESVIASPSVFPRIVGLDQPEITNFCGTHLGGDVFGRTAVGLLDSMIRRHERGIPKEPTGTIIHSRWVEPAPPPSPAAG